MEFCTGLKNAVSLPQDLARWKSRRRSASQDLIKKEEERKKMEKLLAGEDGMSERRKSIKTYREIVQEKWVLSVVASFYAI